jgi:hypothetical protein
MRKLKLTLLITGVLISGISCVSQKKQNNPAAFYDYEVECLGTGIDGTQLIKVWGYGKSPNGAVEQAKKNAVHAIMFKGIQAGKPGCMTRPLITDAGAEQQHKDYFDAFFQTNGKYMGFVNVSNDGSIDPNDRLKAGGEYKIGVVVSVSHSTLRKELEAAGIIKPLGTGF